MANRTADRVEHHIEGTGRLIGGPIETFRTERDADRYMDKQPVRGDICRCVGGGYLIVATELRRGQFIAVAHGPRDRSQIVAVEET
jgi:hypothetical protein